MTALQYLIPFFIAFGVLVNVHEFGHYLVARLCGVKILRFSIGIGKVIYSRRFGADQTEWAISMLPLGGYVSMLDQRNQDLGEIPEADLKREFTRQNVWRRIAIVAAGPMANFLLAIVLFSYLYINGVPDFATRLHVVAEHTAAYDAGLRGGETIVSVNGSPVKGWSEAAWDIMQAALDKKPATVEFEPSVRLVNNASGLGKATIVLDAIGPKELETNFMKTLGMQPAMPKPIINKVVPDGPEARAGLRDGDLILLANDTPVAELIAAKEIIRAAPGKTVRFHVQRGSATLDVDVVPDAIKDGDKSIGQIKVEFVGPDTVLVRQSPFIALKLAAIRTWDMSLLQVKMIGKMITGSVSWKNINGVISIADYAGQAAHAGTSTYVNFIASVSIAIGVMNLLPIPVLDGGLLLYYSLEVLTRRPISRRFAEIAQVAGIVMLATLMIVALFNDFVRLDLLAKIAELVRAV